MKHNSLLRYRGKRAGNVNNEGLVISTVIRPRYTKIPRTTRPRILSSATLCAAQPSQFTSATLNSARFALLNARSGRNKRVQIKDYIVENNIAVLALTETLLHSGDCDNQVIGDLIPEGFYFHHEPREDRGGGVGIVIKDGFEVIKGPPQLNEIFILLSTWMSKLSQPLLGLFAF